eukprot:4959455-Prymnesium_polylepis.1
MSAARGGSTMSTPGRKHTWHRGGGGGGPAAAVACAAAGRKSAWPLSVSASQRRRGLAGSSS